MAAPNPSTPRNDPWRVIIPVKDARVGKSRLVASVAGADEHLRRAIADDTIRAVVAAVGASGVVLVTSDVPLGRQWSEAGVAVLPDPGTGLNGAIVAGLSAHARDGRLRAALLGDLPALQPDDLVTALRAASEHAQSFVPDQDGTGTVLRCGPGFVPHFGRHSAAAHAADGAVRLELDLPSLRTDVDDRESLVLASRLGLGASTKSALRRLGLG